MNIPEAREMLFRVSGREYDPDAAAYLEKFIDEVEHLLKHNSIKQTPALLKPFGENK